MGENTKDELMGAGTVLRGNFVPKGSENPELKADTPGADETMRSVEEFEQAARGRIGGSIAFVTRLAGQKGSPLLLDED